MALDFETILATLETHLTDIQHQLSEAEWASFTEGLMELGNRAAQVSRPDELESLTDDMTALCARYPFTKALLRSAAHRERRLPAAGAGPKPETPVKELMNRFIGLTQLVKATPEKTPPQKGKQR